MRIKALSSKQRRLMKWAFQSNSGKAVICDGAVRSGKTVCMTLAFILWAMRYFDRCNFGVCGKTVASAERNIIAPTLDMEDLRDFFNLEYHKSDHFLLVRGNGHENRFYIFGGKDESSYTLIQGITLAGVLFDEVALMPESFVDQGIARTLSVPKAKLWFNCNPESPGHWFYKEWIQQPEKKRALHLHFLMEDNPIMTADAIEDAKRMYSGTFFDRYILGLWVAAEGRIYDMFDRTRNVIHSLPETAGDSYVSVDYGTLNPTVFLLWRRVRGSERWICTREYYYSGREKKRQKTDSEFADDLAQWLDGEQPRAFVVDPSAASFITELRRRGYAVQQADNEVLDGIREVGKRLRSGDLAVHDSCVRTLEEFNSYVWDEKASARGEDKPLKDHDHAMDAIRYFVNTILGRQVVAVRRKPGVL